MLVVKKLLSRGRTAEEYNPRDYWTGVARGIKQRSHESGALAGDDTPFLRYKRDIFLTKFLDQIPAQGKSVLEVGCGPAGNLTRIAKLQPNKLVGCDISEGMVELAQENTRDLENVEIAQMDGTSLPFPDQSFDVTFTATVLEHNNDTMLAKLLPEICRVTSDRLYLFEDTVKRKQEWFTRILRPVNEYASLCASEGFELIAADPIGLNVSNGLHYTLYAAFSLLNHQEGMTIKKTYALLERTGLTITRPLDKIIVRRSGLTRMVFRRKS